MKSLKIIFTSAIVFFYSYSYGQQVYSTPGSYSWIVPECVTEVTVKVWGAGGGGGAADSHMTNTCHDYPENEACSAAGGGGGGGFAMRTYTVVPGETYQIHVGAGGSGGSAGGSGATGNSLNNGSNGGQSTFSGPATLTPGTLTATGGVGGGGARTNNTSSFTCQHQGHNGTGGSGGSGSNGTVNRTGGNGSGGAHSGSCNDRSGAGGGAGAENGNGGNGTFAACPNGSMSGGIGATISGGNGGSGIQSGLCSGCRDRHNGNSGATFGGGGGGALVHLNNYANSWARANGGSGAHGAVILEYIVPPAPSTPTITGPLIVCQGASQGYSVAVDPNATGYNWSYTGTGTITNDGNNSISLNNIQTSGTLTVELVGSCGSGPSNSINIVVIDPPILSGISGPAVVCENGSGSYSVTNIPGASYSWSYTGGGTIVNGNTNSITINNITSSGTLTVTATNSCGSDSETFNITVEINPAQPIIDIVDPTCDVDGSAEITNYNSGVTYVFNPTGPNFNSTTGDLENFNFGQIYTVVAENANGCTSTETSFTIGAQLPTPSVPIISIVDPTCDVDGSAEITNYSSGVTYVFNPTGPSVDATGNITGAIIFGQAYTVVAESTNGCTSPETSFTIEARLPTPSAPIISIVDPTCDVDGSAEITNYNSGVTYVFNPTGPNFNSTTGDLENFNFGQAYTVVAENANGCTSPISSLTVEEKYTTPAAPVVDVTPANCDGDGTATISGYDSNLTYNLTTGTGTIGADGSISGVAGNYTITATENGCTSPETPFTIEAQLPTPAAPIISIVDPTCDVDGSAEITNYNSGVTYVFNPTGPNFNSTTGD
ncbi:MAG: glycine-rich domain-containing protein, partial [Brumimicrobium sp.]